MTMFGESIKLAAWRFRRLGMGAAAMQEGLRRREGECRSCGACCQLRSMWPITVPSRVRCPALTFDAQGRSFCVVHKHRPGLCRVFPIDEADLAARNLVSPGTRCGYRFRSRA